MLNRLFPYLFAALLLCAGCSHDNGRATAPIRIQPYLESRVTALDFETGDCIALNIDRPTGAYAVNVPLTYDGTAFRSSSLAWYAGDDAATFTACHPYDAAGFPQHFTIASDQSSGLTASDLLGARSEQVTPTSSAVPMRFRHLLARLTITLTNADNAAVTAVRLDGLAGTATIDWSTLAVTAAESSRPVTPCPETENTYGAILVPQEGQLTVEVTTADGQRRARSVQVALQGGKSYRLSLTLQAETLELLLAGEIEDWQESGDPVVGEKPDPTPDPKPDDPQPPTEGQLTIGTEQYALRTIGGKVWMAENLRTLPAGTAVGTGLWYPAQQGVEDASMTKELGYLYAHATAVQLCPAGWHLPSQEELAALIGAQTGEGFFREADAWRNMAANAGYLKKSYLLGQPSAADATKCSVLLFTAAGASQTATLAADWGFSVRFVKD